MALLSSKTAKTYTKFKKRLKNSITSTAEVEKIPGSARFRKGRHKSTSDVSTFGYLGLKLGERGKSISGLKSLGSLGNIMKTQKSKKKKNSQKDSARKQFDKIYKTKFLSKKRAFSKTHHVRKGSTPFPTGSKHKHQT